MELRQAYDLAQRIKSQLAPFCEPGRCEIVGSIRRAREHVNDIDLVVVPKAGQRLALLARAKQTTHIISEGEQIVMLRLKNGTQLDLYFAHNGTGDLFESEPSNWGSVLLCRTGSKEHNMFICQRAQSMGLKWVPPRGIVAPGGWRCSGTVSSDAAIEDARATKVIASATEEEIFQTLGLAWIPPAVRER